MLSFTKALGTLQKEQYVNFINYSIIYQSLTELKKILVPKLGKDLEMLTNWRPIALLNIDYKIANKAIYSKQVKESKKNKIK